MARGIRKSSLEKLQIELGEVNQSIQQYEDCLRTLKKRLVHLQEQMQVEECKAVTELIRAKGISLDDLKEMLEDKVEMEQSA